MFNFDDWADEDAKAVVDDPSIAVVGMSCYMADASTPEQLWENLLQTRDCITEIPASRWPTDLYRSDITPHKTATKWGSFAHEYDWFDNEFFGVSHAEAVDMDPQQRMFLEVAYQAFHRAGYTKKDLHGSDTGVYLGICTFDQLLRDTKNNVYSATGSAHSIAANRISFQLGLQGPSISMDTACSSSLVAVDLACRALKDEQCELALAAGVNGLTVPKLTIIFSQMGMMAADGRCKTFDARANGYVRGEGCGAVVLKRTQDLAAGDTVLAKVLATALNQDGQTATLTAPNGQSQIKVIQSALNQAGVPADSINYCECHGTGTPLGDPIEIGAIAATYGLKRSDDNNLVLGSIKTNVGHLEGAAGIAGMIKAILVLQHRKVPGNVHFQTLNPMIHEKIKDKNIIVSNKAQDLPATGPVRASVSSFGFGGTNSHIILEGGDINEPTEHTYNRTCFGVHPDNHYSVQWVKAPLTTSSPTKVVVYEGESLTELLNHYATAKKEGIKLWYKRSLESSPSGLRGVLQTMFLEDPATFGGVVEYDANSTVPDEEYYASSYRVRYLNNVRYEARLVQDAPLPKPRKVPTDGWCLITGGTGTLGRAAARQLKEAGVNKFLLVSRSSNPPDSFLTNMQPSEVVVKHLDLGQNPEALNALFDEYNITGVVHAAGQLKYLPLDASVEEYMSGASVKINGAKVLHAKCQTDKVSLFWLFSSVSSVWGYANAANYSMSNAFLDELAEQRNTMGLPVQVTRFGAFGGSAMTEGHEDDLKTVGIGLLEQREVMMAWSYGADVYANMHFDRFLKTNPSNWSLFRDIQPTTSVEAETVVAKTPLFLKLENQEPEERLQSIQKLIKDAVEAGTGEQISNTDPFLEAGVDSLSAVTVRDQLGQATGLTLTNSVLLDYPNVLKLSRFVVEEMFQNPTEAAQPEVVYQSKDHEDIAVVGVALKFPGDNNDPFTLWDNLLKKQDAITTVPEDRWGTDFYDADKNQPGKYYVNQGGFVKDLDMFDTKFFGISPAEAKVMDPQQKLSLETCFQAAHVAGWTKESLLDSETGVFVGACQYDYLQHVDIDTVSTYSATGMTNSILANRISYALGLCGPSITMDTACSSSLVATHLAMKALNDRECDRAFAGGTSLILSPLSYVAASKASMLSPTGRCHTFDQRANGFVRGEGCGFVALQRAKDVQDAATVWGYLVGSAVNQDGRTANLTAPSGPRQEAVIRRAVQSARLTVDDVDYLECHGTGTKIGDPMEVQAIKNVFGKRATDKPLVLGAIKSNIGHLEGAAGIAGIIKTLLVLGNKVAPANIQLQTLNPEIQTFESLVIANQPHAFDTTSPLYGGVSSFGFGGTNAHVILKGASLPKEYPKYPFQRERLPHHNRYHTSKVNVFQAERVSSNQWRKTWDASTTKYVSGHRVGTTALVPATAYMEMLLPCIKDVHGSDTAFELFDMEFKNVLLLADGNPDLTITLEGNTFTIASQDGTEHAVLHWRPVGTHTQSIDLDQVKARCPEVMDGHDFYQQTGNNYRGDFASIHTIYQGTGEMLVHVDFKASKAAPELQACAWGDSCIHGGILFLDHQRKPFYAEKAGKYLINTMNRTPRQHLWAHIQYLPETKETVVHVYDHTHELITSIYDTKTNLGETSSFGSNAYAPLYRHVQVPATETSDEYETVELDPSLWKEQVLQLAHTRSQDKLVLVSREISTGAAVGFVKTLVLEEGSPWKIVHAPKASNVLVSNSVETTVENGSPIRSSLVEVPLNPVQPKDDVVWITGGTGALGRLLVEHLMEYNKVVVSGRKETWTNPIPNVDYIQCNMSDYASVEHCIRTIKPNVVVHAAGLLDDKTISRLSLEDWEKVWQAKATGAMHLHKITQQVPVDNLIFFSSISSLLGNVGQGNYASSNAFLDRLTVERNQLGLPATSIQWGAWAQGGMATEGDVLYNARTHGYGVVVPRVGLACLNSVWTQAGVFAVSPFEWDLVQTPFKHLFAEHVVEDTEEASSDEWTSLPDSIRASKVKECIHAIVYDCVGEHVDEDAPLMEAGIDSLTSVELRNALQKRFGLTLAATVLFDYPNIKDMAKYIDSQFTSSDPFATDPDYTFSYDGPVDKCRNFTVARANVGQVVFPGQLDVTKLDINTCLTIETDKSKAGGVLANQPVLLTYHNFMKPDQVTSKTRKALAKALAKQGGTLYYLDKETGTICFSKKGL